MALLRHTQFVPHTTRSHHSTALVSILYFPKSLPGILENRKLITVVTFLIIQIARSMSVCDRNRTFLIISSSEFLNQKVKKRVFRSHHSWTSISLSIHSIICATASIQIVKSEKSECTKRTHNL